ncbi:SET domain-containing protein SmydA-8-like [Portunus trituberculatus]|uniref:SET domain-containing protein SmydA-8-like n=1 Tax=Portunus trituberculatus TaxID=210409 RepID=UPI001E1CF4F2|nr:SET domain-containing protein SmydA-8-like [Portunus trituberculatus]
MGGAEAPDGDAGGEVGVLEERLRGLLSHNPAWLGQDGAPPWCADLSMNHEELLERTRQWAAAGCGAQGASGSIAAPMRVAHSEELGRHLVATRDVAAGEVVVVEPPLLLALRERSPPSCLTCFRRATVYTCPACGFFLCGPECGAAAHAEECGVLRRLGLGQPAPRPEEEARLAALPDEQRAQAREMLQQAAATAEQQRRLEVLRQYRLVAAVRTLLVMHRSPAVAAAVAALQGRVNPSSTRHANHQRRVVEVAVGQLGVTNDPALAHRVCAVWDTNGFEVPLAWGNRVVGLFPVSSLLTHDCRANTQQWFTAEGVVVVRAVTRVAAGDVLTTCYTDPQWATLLRQDHLRISKQFTCTCARCRDPTELGTFLGSPCCPACRLPLLSTDPLDPQAPWRCSNHTCTHTATAAQVAGVGAGIGAKLKGLTPNDAAALASLSRQLEEMLPSTHHVLMQLHVSTLKTLVARDLREVNDEDLSTLLAISSLVMGVLRRLEQPLTRLSVRMGREEIRLAVESERRGLVAGQAARDRLQELRGVAEECKLVMGWDTRMPPFQSVYSEYRGALQRLATETQG